MESNYQSLSHSKWDCKYHVVFVPKYRRKALYGEIRRQLGPILHELAKQKECQIIEGHLMSDHVHIQEWARVLNQRAIIFDGRFSHQPLSLTQNF